ncbi:hypothetical protein C8Q74DRAFT_920128 [Fomes fomentarius]|nr:hypothetical protein C8Q74DRAFT_920128 [Fomes fomentarius]
MNICGCTHRLAPEQGRFIFVSPQGQGWYSHAPVALGGIKPQPFSLYHAVPPALSTTSVVVVSSTPHRTYTHSSTHHRVSYIAHCCCAPITTPSPPVQVGTMAPSSTSTSNQDPTNGRIGPMLAVSMVGCLVGFIVLIVSFRYGSRCLRACGSKRTRPPPPSPSHTCPHAPATRGGITYPVASAARSRCLLCVLEQRKRREAAERARADRDSLALPPPPYPTSASPSPVWTGTGSSSLPPSPEALGRGTEEAREGVPPYTVAAPAAPPPRTSLEQRSTHRVRRWRVVFGRPILHRRCVVRRHDHP